MISFFKHILKFLVENFKKIKKLELTDKLYGAVVFVLGFLFLKLNLLVFYLNKILFWCIEDKHFSIFLCCCSFIIIFKCVYLVGWTDFLFFIFISNILQFSLYKKIKKLWIISFFLYVILFIYVY